MFYVRKWRTCGMNLRFILSVFLCLVCNVLADLVPSFTKEPRSVVVRHQGQVTLDCIVMPPSASIRWMHNGHHLQTNRANGIEIFHNNSLHISRRSHDHDGTYYCVAVTAAGKILSKPAILSKPVLGHFSNQLRNVRLNATIGSTIALPCKVPESNPPAKIVFNLNNNLVTDTVRHIVLPSGNMQIQDVRRSDQGVYRCIAINPINHQNRTADNRIYLSVHEAPSLRVPPSIIGAQKQTIDAILGSEVVLECAARGKPQPSYSWVKYGGMLPQKRTEKIFGNLKILNVELWDQGTYICQVSHGKGEMVNKVIIVNVKAAPVVQIPNPNIMAYTGQTVKIPCEVESRDINPIVNWYHNAEAIRMGGRMIVQDTMLIINNVQLSNVGLYQCVATSDSGTASAIARLIVYPWTNTGGNEKYPHGVLTYPVRPRSITIQSEANANITLPCNTTNAANIQWWKNGARLLLSNSQSRGESGANVVLARNGSLMLIMTTVRDNGMYVCRKQSSRTGLSTHLDALSVIQYRVKDNRYGQSDGDGGTVDRSSFGPNSTVAGGSPVGGDENDDDHNQFDYDDNAGTVGGKNSRPGRKNRKHRGRNRGGRKPAGGDAGGGTWNYPDDAVMIPPTRPDVSKLSDTSVMLNWSVPENDGLDITFFRVQYKEVHPRKGDWQTVDRDISPTQRKFEVSNLKRGATYKFRMAAVYTNDDNMIGPNSNRFTLEQELYNQPRRPTEKPTIVAVKAMEHGGVYALVVQWQYHPKEPNAVQGFILEHKPHYSDKPYKQIRLSEPGIRSHIIQGLLPDTSYSIRMTCFNKAGASVYSNLVVSNTVGPIKDPMGEPPFHHRPSNVDPRPKEPSFEIPFHLRPPNVDSRLNGQNKPDATPPPRSPVVLPPQGTNPDDDDRGGDSATSKSDVAKGEQKKTDSESSNQLLYMILGIVLGILMLVLIVFMVMCGLKQRQHRRAFANKPAGVIKYPDQTQVIYTDSKGKNFMNGGFALNGINTNMPNGHAQTQSPHHVNGQLTDNRNLNISVNPIADMDQRQEMGSQERAMRASDNNFNSIDRNNKSYHYASAGVTHPGMTTFIPGHPGIPIVELPPPPPVQRASPHHQQMGGQTHTPPPHMVPPAIQYSGGSSSSHGGGGMGNLYSVPNNYLDNGDDFYDNSSDDGSGVGHPLQYHERSIGCGPSGISSGSPGHMIQLHQLPPAPLYHCLVAEPPRSQHHKRRRKPRQSSHDYQLQHQQQQSSLMRDQATNTDISSNEGTIENSSLPRLPMRSSPDNSFTYENEPSSRSNHLRYVSDDYPVSDT